MKYSPKLKKAMTEINEILVKHDIAGIVVLHTPGNSEYLLRIDPSYSCAKVSEGRLRIRAKKEDFKGTPKEKELSRNKMLADTSNMFKLLTETSGTVVYPLFEVSEKLDELLKAEHTDKGHTSSETQNN